MPKVKKKKLKLSNEIEKEFRTKFENLIKEYHAQVTFINHDIDGACMHVSMPAIYCEKEDRLVQEFTTFKINESMDFSLN